MAKVELIFPPSEESGRCPPSKRPTELKVQPSSRRGGVSWDDGLNGSGFGSVPTVLLFHRSAQERFDLCYLGV